MSVIDVYPRELLYVTARDIALDYVAENQVLVLVSVGEREIQNIPGHSLHSCSQSCDTEVASFLGVFRFQNVFLAISPDTKIRFASYRGVLSGSSDPQFCQTSSSGRSSRILTPIFALLGGGA